MNSFTRRDALLGMLGLGGALSLNNTPAFGNPESTGYRDQEYGFAPGLIYLNTGSLGPTPRSILEATLRAWHELESNPVAMTYGDGAVHKLTDTVREKLGGFIGCAADEILITRSTTDAMNATGLGIDFERGDRVLTTNVEHEGGSIGWKYLKKYRGVEIDAISIAPNDHDVNGIVTRLEKAITKQTKVISVSHVITSTGLQMPIAEIATLAKKRGVLSVIDGAQAIGQIPVNVKDLGCDAYAAPGHKWLMAPKGTGFLYINKDSASRIHPVEREDGVRFVVESTGVGNIPLIIGMGAALDAIQARGISAVERHNIELRNRAYAGLRKIPKIEVVSAPPGPLASALVAFRLPDSIESSAFRIKMKEKYKLVLKMTEKRWFNGMRISPHIFNTAANIDLALNAIRTELS